MTDRGRGHFVGLRIDRTRRVRAAALASLWLLASGAAARAETPARESKPPAEGASAGDEAVLNVPGHATSRTGAGGGEPGLDDLLRLPSDFNPERSTARPVAGASEEEWKQRFARAEKAIGEARETLAATRRELDGVAETGGASQWSVAPPGASGGGGPTTSPLSFKLRQELQRNREALDEAEKALRELRIEADLAGVPPEWRVVAASPTPAPAPDN
jgi:hypothetical protein